jgi:hypothetical protein
MDENTSPDKTRRYKVRRNDDDLMRNLHLLYDDVCQEPVPDYLVDLLKKLPR